MRNPWSCGTTRQLSADYQVLLACKLFERRFHQILLSAMVGLARSHQARTAHCPGAFQRWECISRNLKVLLLSQELEHDLLRQARVQHNAVMIETRDREAAERVEAPGNSGLLAPRQVHALSELPGGSLLYAEDAKDVRPASVQKAAEIPKENEDPWKAAASSDEPQGWSPSVGPRGRGV